MEFSQQEIKFPILYLDKIILSLNKIFLLIFSIFLHKFLLPRTDNIPFQSTFKSLSSNIIFINWYQFIWIYINLRWCIWEQIYTWLHFSITNDGMIWVKDAYRKKNFRIKEDNLSLKTAKIFWVIWNTRLRLTQWPWQ